MKPGDFPIVDLLKKHRSSSSMVLRVEDQLVFDHNAAVPRPLASLIKVPVMLAFVENVNQGGLDPDEPIALNEVAAFFIPWTDDGAHEAWLNEIEKRRPDASHVSYWELIEGMMLYSSNANFDFLLNALGLEYVNAFMKGILPQHEAIYPITSAVPLLAKHKSLLQPFIGKAEQIKPAFEKMAIEHFKRQINDPAHENHRQPIPDLQLQALWSDLFPKASALDYLQLISAVNNSSSSSMRERLALKSFQWAMSLSRYQHCVHAGEKTGHTVKTFNKLMFFKENSGRTLEMVYLIDGLTLEEKKLLHETDSKFSHYLTGNEQFVFDFVSLLEDGLIE